ncbi:MAG: TolC family protein [Ignavibacteria bacterium]|nr:TolC family protein [Ignavibacteria bacterium]
MRTVLLSIILTFFTITIQAQKDLTLAKAIQIALHKNSTLQKSINGLEGFESNVQASTGNFLPTLSFGARWDWTKSDRKGVGTTVINGNIIPVGASSTETRNFRGNINSSWTLFDGLSNFATHSQSKTDLQSAEFSLDRLKQDIVFTTTSLFYDIIKTQKLLEVTEANLIWNEKNLETITERNKLGAATLADVYQQEVATGNAELDIIRTNNQLEVAKNELLFYLALNVLKEYTFSDEITDEEAKVLKTDLAEDYVKISDYVTESLKNRLDYLSAQLNLEAAKDGVTIAQSGHWPRLTVDAIYFLEGNNLADIDNTKTLNIGMGLNFPLFLGWSVTNQVQFAQVDVKNKEVELNDLERNIKRQLQQTFLDLQAAFKFLKVSESNIAFADENLKIEQERYSLGSGKLLDVLIANSNYTNALTDLINAQFVYLVLSEQLDYYVGVLDFSKYE